MEVIVYVVLGGSFFCNIALFFLMGYDKSKARKGQWRVKEKHLWLFALLGGSLGGVVGMRTFRHKTKHARFRFGWPVLAFLQVASLLTLVWFYFR
ncbi:DUF1294 domain-containing protein [Halobacillus amylolyticus]|uniref:DUF1294 domain-containing protein n=1 Tax=Halobacillus amylolyticus TaxID=2932259 RepID=A0ABY4HBN8_9BACI|nr:DUF1294 domain-containing protein [Halobacillus amylolyticus]UOR11971.1 DUF1294 domain-containing protein [Halobacillus amylolyticus]